MVKKVSVTRTATVLGESQTIVVAEGILTVAGETKELVPTGNKDYPVAEGWFKHTSNSYIQITPTDIKIEAKIGNTMVPIPVEEPKPVPANSKWLSMNQINKHIW